MTKLCRDCKHRTQDVYVFYCAAPHLPVDIVYGDIKAELCRVYRQSGDGNCGPFAKYYEEKDVHVANKSRWFDCLRFWKK